MIGFYSLPVVYSKPGPYTYESFAANKTFQIQAMKPLSDRHLGQFS